jgi:hypothetical protein
MKTFSIGWSLVFVLVLGVTGCGDSGGGSAGSGGSASNPDCTRLCENPCVGEYLPPGAVDDCERSCNMGFFTCIPELIAGVECIEAMGCDGTSPACLDESAALAACL